MLNPYSTLPKDAFWRTAVAEKNPLQINDLWDPKISLSKRDKIATFGSCFAQHIGHALSARGYLWYDAEPSPKMVSPELQHKYNYGIFSARTGNIYSAKALLQWVTWALQRATPPQEVWEHDGRYYDPFRPAIEPNGFASSAELFASRQITLDAIRDVIDNADLFVFTFGLTEAWENINDGYTYALCPGTLAGEFNSAEHRFVNYTFDAIFRDFSAAKQLIKDRNPNIRFLLTVSPVPLTATASAKHVVVATTYSKSVLRAVAGQIADEHTDIDYFPSYEIITAPPFRGMFYEPNARSVAHEGVNFVMDSFFGSMYKKYPIMESSDNQVPAKGAEESDQFFDKPSSQSQAVCEEQMLAQFQTS